MTKAPLSPAQEYIGGETILPAQVVRKLSKKLEAAGLPDITHRTEYTGTLVERVMERLLTIARQSYRDVASTILGTNSEAADRAWLDINFENGTPNLLRVPVTENLLAEVIATIDDLDVSELQAET